MAGCVLSADISRGHHFVEIALHPSTDCTESFQSIDGVDKLDSSLSMGRAKTALPGQLLTTRIRKYPRLSRIYETLQPGAKEAKRRKRAKHIRRARQQAVRHIEGLLSPCVQPAFLKDQAWVDLALHQWLGVKRPRTWMDFDLERRLGTSVDKITNWIRYIAMTDPALFCVEACAAVFFSLPKDSESLKNYLWLENHAVQQINLALNDPGRRFSSLTIVAILFCASYYAFCGDIRIARDVHVPGLKRILAIKGEERFVEELPAPVVAMSPWYAQQVTKTCGVAEPIFSWSGPDGGDVLAMIRSAVSEDLA